MDVWPVKALLIDIETSPILADVWGIWQQNVGINQIKVPGEVICFAAKWYGEKKTIFKSSFHDSKPVMISEMHRVLSEADAVITYNGINFDRKWMNTEFLLAGMTPPDPSKNIDLLRVVKQNFRFPSNKLQYVLSALDLGSKASTGGHELWIRCMAGDPQAWATMKKYNIHDVVVMEPLYERLLPWISGHPNVALIDGIENGCPNCGSTDLERRGFTRTTVSTFQRFQCRKCGRWMRGNARLAASTMTGVVQ